ncbi:TonB-dependent receptor [Kordiimonas pumila]|uniref:TonB-dependent receptor n=1 Tax=Kordiimonas pumila TaxID=2161677 RepID=A0ABV7D4M8_9PROT|nr:TonB-dependent receptor [Kordiimonas pumila]
MIVKTIACFIGSISLFDIPAIASATIVETGYIEEVIVTTQKRAQNIRTVPLSVTSYDGDFLSKLNMEEFDRVSDITPGLIIQEQSPNNPAFVIRGITSDNGSPQIAPRVSIYLNGVDVSRSRGSHFELFDIDRIEVVKGPQATLFGTAAAIGAVAVITKKPQKEFAGELTLGYGNYNSMEAKGFVTGGHTKLQGRLAFSYRKRDGYIENIAGDIGSQSAGGIVQPDLNGLERFAVRSSLRFIPNTDLTVDLVLNYEKDADTGTSFKSGTFAPTDGTTSPFSFAELAGGGPLSADVLGNDKLGIDRALYDANLTVVWSLSDIWTLTSITGYREFDSLEVFDADGSQAIYAEFAEDATGNQFSQELRANYAHEKLNAFFGVNYFNENGRVEVPFLTEEGTFLQCAAGIIPDLPCVAPSGAVGSITAAQNLPSIYYASKFGNTGNFHIYSAFADATVEATDRLSLTAGVRYIYETRESGGFATLPASILTGAPLIDFGYVDTAGSTVSEKDNFDAILPRFNARYAINDTINLYASVSKGRRSNVIEVTSTAGPNNTPVANAAYVPAEITWNYETGFKGRFMDGRLDLAASLFYQTYDNFQVTIRQAGITRQANAGTARNIGAEGEFRASISKHFELFGTAAYIDAGIDDKAENGIFAGNRFRLQPEWSTALGGLWTIPITSAIKVTGNVTWTYRSSVFFEIENQPVAGVDISEGAVHLVNANIALADSEDRWALSFYVTNLFNKDYIIDAGNIGGLFGSPTLIAGPPRFVGVQVSTRF